MSDIRVCPRCRRASPQEAAFCYYDGQDLRLVLPGMLEPWELGKEFVFPSGQRCRTFDEFVAGCVADWPTARELLRQGALHQFFSAIGRADIAQAAWRALRQSGDLDEALDAFLAALPTRDAVRPELDLTPRRLQFGRVIAGDRRTVVLRIINKGKRLLHGKVRLEGCDWLEIEGLERWPNSDRAAPASASPAGTNAIAGADAVPTPSPSPQLLPAAEDAIPVAELISVGNEQEAGPLAWNGQVGARQAPAAPSPSEEELVYRLLVWKEQELRVTVITGNLVAGQSYHTRLIVESNGGTAEIPVDVQVGAIPFAEEPFRGISDPKYLAAQMRTRTKEAVRLLREGVVRRWFEQNHWVWPVVGETAPGIAAVQQFYEALGVTNPPRLEIHPDRLEFTLQSADAKPVARAIEYRSPDPKWVYAKIQTDVPWLRVEPTSKRDAPKPLHQEGQLGESEPGNEPVFIYGPRTATFQVIVLPEQLPAEPGRYQGEVQIEGNGGQKLSLPVLVEVPDLPLERVMYVLLGSLVFGLAGAALRLLVAWADLVGVDSTRTWRAFASLVRTEVSGAWGWLVAATVALVVAVWLAEKMYRRSRAWEDAFSGFVGGGLLGLLAGLVLSWLIAHAEPVLAQWTERVQSGGLAEFPGIAVAVWYLIGAVVGMGLAFCGAGGRRAIRWLSREYARLARQLGWRKVAEFFALRW